MVEKTAEQPVQAADGITQVDLAVSQWSAMVDDELAHAEIHLAVRRLSRDRDIQQRWERYQLISDTLQGHLPAAVDPGFAARLREAIDREPLPQPQPRSLFQFPIFQSPIFQSLPGWYRPVTGLALAASVTLAVLVGLQLSRPDAALLTTPSPIAALPLSPPARTARTVAFQPPDILQPDEPAAERLNSYLVNHNGQASRNSVNGMLPYVRMVGYQTQR